ncbi:MAG: hypothetical protein IT353_22405 [Gemmatimonadaceae bacterium]|nr:hypothetical protein [Gemmatimonadaceae bacterium]
MSINNHIASVRGRGALREVDSVAAGVATYVVAREGYAGRALLTAPMMPGAVRHLLAVLLLASGCVGGPRPGASAAASATPVLGGPSTAPADLLGRFTDDYNGSYVITPTRWQHGSRLAYEIDRWHIDSQYLIARNAATNARDAGTWVRIDWMALHGLPPYTWAYCLTAYNAPTRDSAARTPAAQRATPRTGCNNFPFSRMQRAAAR